MRLSFSRRSLCAFMLATGVSLGGLSSAFAADHTLKLGVMSGPEEDIAQVAVKVAKSKGLDVQLVTFSNYALPNEALSGGDLYANAFQTQPFMDAQIHARGYNIASAGLTLVEPLGFYSSKISKISELPQGAKVAIQSDASNQGRALNLLAANHVITLTANAPSLPSLADIEKNPSHIQFIELDAAQLPRSLSDVTMAAINTNYLIGSGIDPNKALIREEVKNNPYANLIAVRKGDENKEETKKLVQSFQSEEVRKYLLDTFHNAILPAW